MYEQTARQARQKELTQAFDEVLDQQFRHSWVPEVYTFFTGNQRRGLALGQALSVLYGYTSDDAFEILMTAVFALFQDTNANRDARTFETLSTLIREGEIVSDDVGKVIRQWLNKEYNYAT